MMAQGGGGGGAPGGPVGATAASGSASSAPAESKHWMTLYPIYFDTKQPHKTGGRRVSWRKSCLFPHSLGIAKSVAQLGLPYSHEPAKSHPRDWENPGRVKVKVLDEDGQKVKGAVGNRTQLLNLVAELMQQYCGGPPPIPIPKREKKVRKSNNDKESAEHTSADAKKKGKAASAAPSTSTPSAKAPTTHSASPGSSSRATRIHRAKQLQPYMPPTHIRLPPHSPSISADLLNMDMNKAMGAAGLPGQGAGGANNPMGALGSMMGNLGFGQDEQEEDENQQTEEEKKRQNDPYRGMGRRGRKRVVRVGR